MTVKELIQKTRVLVVEDEEVFRDAIVFEFQRKGFLVSSAANGREALEILSKLRIDVVISDIIMPEVNGIELLARVKSINPNLPIVMLMTGYSDITSESARSKGADALFSKPFDRKTLVDAVMKLVVAQGEALSSLSGSICTDLKANIKFKGEHLSFETRAINLYENGIFVSLKDHFPQVCDPVGFDLFFDDEDTWMGATGIVKWISFQSINNTPPGIGIEFFGLSEARSEKIESLIKAKRADVTSK